VEKKVLEEMDNETSDNKSEVNVSSYLLLKLPDNQPIDEKSPNLNTKYILKDQSVAKKKELRKKILKSIQINKVNVHEGNVVQFNLFNNTARKCTEQDAFDGIPIHDQNKEGSWYPDPGFVGYNNEKRYKWEKLYKNSLLKIKEFKLGGIFLRDFADFEVTQLRLKRHDLFCIK